MSDYARRVIAGMKAISNRRDEVIFTGRVPECHAVRSACCLAETFVDGPDYYAGIPSCRKCRKVLGPEDLVDGVVAEHKLGESGTWVSTEPSRGRGRT